MTFISEQFIERDVKGSKVTLVTIYPTTRCHFTSQKTDLLVYQAEWSSGNALDLNL
jgi:hypothetical protein